MTRLGSFLRTIVPFAISGLSLALVLSGCGGASAVDKPAAPTVTITASPSSINPGAPVTLTVTAANATAITVSGTDGSTFTFPAAGGTKSVSPSATTTYTAAANGSGGAASATATVTVTASPVPTVSIAANPVSIAAGSSSTLTVTATNATQVTLSGTDGSSYSLQAAGGTQVVSPAATTVFTVNASGPGGKASATATVTVTPNPWPTVSISAYPTSIASGGSSILTIVAANATGVVLTGDDGSTYSLQANGGTHTVNPTVTTRYTATATGVHAQAAAFMTLTVTPNPAPTVTITATPPSIMSGGSSTLTVTAINASDTVIAGTDGSAYPLAGSGGIQAVSPSSTTTYTATANGPGGKASASLSLTVTQNPPPAVSLTASPSTIVVGNSSTLTVVAANAAHVTLTGTDGTFVTLAQTGGTQTVTPASTSTYTAVATGPGGNSTANVILTVKPQGSVQSIDHVIFMLQENHSFDNYLGMLNPYRVAKGWNIGDDGKDYEVDGIDDKLTTFVNKDDEGTPYTPFKFTSTCIDDETSDWLASFGDVNRYNFLGTRPILMDGFVHNAEGYANSCQRGGGTCSGEFTDLTGKSSMGYYDQDYLNYYYYMASQFAVSDRWFSPTPSKSVDNRIATFTGGTTQGLVKDPGGDDHLPQLSIYNIFQELDHKNISWKIYYTVTQGFCLTEDECSGGGSNAAYPATYFSNLTYSYQYLKGNLTGTCTPPTQPSSVVGDSGNSFCIDPTHIAPLSAYYTDLTNGTLPSFAFIEAGYGNNDEHPGSGQSVLAGQAQAAKVVNALMASSSWSDSVFFFSYDEAGGPFDHVPPVPGASNKFTSPSLGTIPDVASISVSPDSYLPCVPSGGTPTLHCDLTSSLPGANAADAAAISGFGSQLGFRVPNFIVSPFARRHYVSHTPMDHTAVIKFIENRFIGSAAQLTARDAAQPDLLEFFDFTTVPWASPPSPPAPVTAESLGRDPCKPRNVGP